MIVLASSGNNAVIYSGLIAAIVSGIVSLIGYSITAYIQNKSNKEALKVQKENNGDTIKTQKEIAKMGHKEKLFYESQLEWSNELRKQLAKFVSQCSKYNDLKRKSKSIVNRSKSIKMQNEDVLNLAIQSLDEVTSDLTDLGNEIQVQTSLIRLLCFHRNNIHEQKILYQIAIIIKFYGKGELIPFNNVDKLIEYSQDYFEYQMEELQNKIV